MVHKPAVLAVVTFTALLVASAAFNSLLPMLLGLLVLLRWIRFNPTDVFEHHAFSAHPQVYNRTGQNTKLAAFKPSRV